MTKVTPVSMAVVGGTAPQGTPASSNSGKELAASYGAETSNARPSRPDKAAVMEAVRRANSEHATLKERIGFGYEERLGQLYVKVIDRVTGKVIKEVPPKEFLEHRAAMRELIGLILDKKV